MPSPPPSSAALEKAAYSKVTWRLIPFLFLCYVVAYLDRVNVGFAKLQMLADLKFSETVYGLGAGIFFIGVAAAGIALINSVGNLAGFVGPFMVGTTKDATGSTTAGLYVLAASLFLGGILVLLATRGQGRVSPAGASASRT